VGLVAEQTGSNEATPGAIEFVGAPRPTAHDSASTGGVPDSRRRPRLSVRDGCPLLLRHRCRVSRIAISDLGCQLGPLLLSQSDRRLFQFYSVGSASCLGRRAVDQAACAVLLDHSERLAGPGIGRALALNREGPKSTSRFWRGRIVSPPALPADIVPGSQLQYPPTG
jgi:hypothetical protein